jgi:signal peptidase I
MKSGTVALVLLAILLASWESCSPVKKFKVPTAGMEPTIAAGEEIAVHLEAYRNSSPNPGDIVVFDSPSARSTMIVKRCVAVGGQVVEIRAGILYVDNQQFGSSIVLQRSNPLVLAPDFKDPRIFPSNAGNIDNYGPVTVPQGKFFVLGDHRDNSADSRYFGFVERGAIRGKAVSISDSDDKTRVGKAIK